MSRPAMKDVKDGLKALIIAAVPSGTELIVGVMLDEFMEYDVNKYPRMVCLTYNGGTETSDNLCIGRGNAKQTASWSWAIDVRAGATKHGDDLFDEAAEIMDSLYTGLLSTYPTDGAGPMLVQEEPNVVGYSQGIPIYRYIWRHEVGP